MELIYVSGKLKTLSLNKNYATKVVSYVRGRKNREWSIPYNEFREVDDITEATAIKIKTHGQTKIYSLKHFKVRL